MMASDLLSADQARFLAMISHEIRTPLSGLLGVLAGFDLDNAQPADRQRIQIAKASGEQLRLLLNDLVDLVRLKRPDFVITPQPVSLPHIIDAAIRLWDDSARVNDVRLEAVHAPDMPDYIDLDGRRVRQILDNLMSNAIRFTPGGTVCIQTRVQDAQLWIDVCDDGPGIAAALEEHLFRDFAQLPQRLMPSDGAGLGLAICKELALRMGGDIALVPVMKGSCLRVQLPLIVSDQEGLGLSAEERPPSFPALSILVVDDVTTSREVLRAQMIGLGCTVRCASDGEAALRLMSEAHFDAVLMDMSMPGLDGLEASRRIRALPAPLGSVPIIGISGFVDGASQAAMRSAGMDGFAPKPASAQVLQAAIQAARQARHVQSGQASAGSMAGRP